MTTEPRHDIGQYIARRVCIGGVGKDQLLVQLEDAQVQLNESAKVLFESDFFTTSSVRRYLTTIDLTVSGLGFPQGETMPEIQRKAIALGLCLPPLELGPHLRLQYSEQSEGYLGFQATKHRAPPGSLTIASAPVSDDEEFPKGLYLRRTERVLWLRGYKSDLEHIFDPDDRLVFCAP